MDFGTRGGPLVVLANLLPLVGVVALGWRTTTVAALYWIEVGAVFFLAALWTLFADPRVNSESEDAETDRRVPTPHFDVPFGGWRLRPVAGWPSIDGRNAGYSVAVVLWGAVIWLGLSQAVVIAGPERLPTPTGRRGPPLAEVVATLSATVSEVLSPVVVSVGLVLVAAQAVTLGRAFAADRRADTFARVPYRHGLSVAALFVAVGATSLLVVSPAVVLLRDGLAATAAGDALASVGPVVTLCVGKLLLESYRLRPVGR